MARIRYPSALSLGLGYGIPAGLQSYIASSEAARRSRDLEQVRAMEARRLGLAEAAGARDAAETERMAGLRGALPGALAGFQGALAQSSAAPTIIPDPDAAQAPGVRDPAVVRRPPAVDDTLGRPDVARAQATLLQLGIPTQPMIQSAREIRVNEEEKQRRQAAIDRLPETLAIWKTNPLEGLTAMTQLLATGGLIRSIDLGELSKAVAMDPDLATAEVRRLGGVFEKIAGGTATPQDLSAAMVEFASMRSPAGKIFAEHLWPTLTKTAAFGPVNAFVRAYSEQLKAAPTPTDVATRVTTFQSVAAQPGMMQVAADALALPALADVASALQHTKTRAEAEAKETPALKAERLAKAAAAGRTRSPIPTESTTTRATPITDPLQIADADKLVQLATDELSDKLPAFRASGAQVTLPSGERVLKTDLLRQYLERKQIRTEVEWDPKTKKFVRRGPISRITESVTTKGPAASTPLPRDED